jgi:hypothetical protein
MDGHRSTTATPQFNKYADGLWVDQFPFLLPNEFKDLMWERYFSLEMLLHNKLGRLQVDTLRKRFNWFLTTKRLHTILRFFKKLEYEVVRADQGETPDLGPPGLTDEQRSTPMYNFNKALNKAREAKEIDDNFLEEEVCLEDFSSPYAMGRYFSPRSSPLPSSPIITSGLGYLPGDRPCPVLTPELRKRLSASREKEWQYRREKTKELIFIPLPELRREAPEKTYARNLIRRLASRWRLRMKTTDRQTSQLGSRTEL